MKITVISDTHFPRRGSAIPEIVMKSIQQSDMLIHAGDFTAIELLNYLQKITKVEAVAGNNDGPAITIRLGKKKIIEVSGYRIGIIHGEGFHSTTLERAKQAFSNEKVDIVIFGHSHQAYRKIEGGVLYFNPGSPTDRRTSPKFSFGELTLTNKIKSNIFYFL